MHLQNAYWIVISIEENVSSMFDINDQPISSSSRKTQTTKLEHPREISKDGWVKRDMFRLRSQSSTNCDKNLESRPEEDQICRKQGEKGNKWFVYSVVIIKSYAMFCHYTNIYNCPPIFIIETLHREVELWWWCEGEEGTCLWINMTQDSGLDSGIQNTNVDQISLWFLI